MELVTFSSGPNIETPEKLAVLKTIEVINQHWHPETSRLEIID